MNALAQNAADAIEHSLSYDTCGTLCVATPAEGRRRVKELVLAAEAAKLQADWTDTNEGYDVWGYTIDDPDTTIWRVLIQVIPDNEVMS